MIIKLFKGQFSIKTIYKRININELGGSQYFTSEL